MADNWSPPDHWKNPDQWEEDVEYNAYFKRNLPEHVTVPDEPNESDPEDNEPDNNANEMVDEDKIYENAMDYLETEVKSIEDSITYNKVTFVIKDIREGRLVKEGLLKFINQHLFKYPLIKHGLLQRFPYTIRQDLILRAGGVSLIQLDEEMEYIKLQYAQLINPPPKEGEYAVLLRTLQEGKPKGTFVVPQPVGGPEKIFDLPPPPHGVNAVLVVPTDKKTGPYLKFQCQLEPPLPNVVNPDPKNLDNRNFGEGAAFECPPYVQNPLKDEHLEMGENPQGSGHDGPRVRGRKRSKSRGQNRSRSRGHSRSRSREYDSFRSRSRANDRSQTAKQSSFKATGYGRFQSQTAGLQAQPVAHVGLQAQPVAHGALQDESLPYGGLEVRHTAGYINLHVPATKYIGLQAQPSGFGGMQPQTHSYSGVQPPAAGYSGLQPPAAGYSGSQGQAAGHSGYETKPAEYYGDAQATGHSSFQGPGDDRSQDTTTTTTTNTDTDTDSEDDSQVEDEARRLQSCRISDESEMSTETHY